MPLANRSRVFKKEIESQRCGEQEHRIRLVRGPSFHARVLKITKEVLFRRTNDCPGWVKALARNPALPIA